MYSFFCLKIQKWIKNGIDLYSCPHVEITLWYFWLNQICLQKHCLDLRTCDVCCIWLAPFRPFCVCFLHASSDCKQLLHQWDHGHNYSWIWQKTPGLIRLQWCQRFQQLQATWITKIEANPSTNGYLIDQIQMIDLLWFTNRWAFYLGNLDFPRPRYRCYCCTKCEI